ncbi:Hpt domain-containing protein [Sphingomonas sp.]|uniref:Hpt domain-containing protein n=1 Tax=Sphingomonas sp. TaxID=28214 RepID=UPI0025E374EB|nr:Hpt domain-containing protein [Sphingomonas sp.]
MYENGNDIIVDRSRFEQACKELGPGFSKILSYYRDDGARAIQEIERAARDRNTPCMVRPAHTLKGDSLMVGAEAIGLAAEEIEKAARHSLEMHDFPDHMVPRVRELSALFTETMTCFDKLMAERVRVPVAPPVMPRRPGGFGRKVG